MGGGAHLVVGDGDVIEVRVVERCRVVVLGGCGRCGVRRVSARSGKVLKAAARRKAAARHSERRAGTHRGCPWPRCHRATRQHRHHLAAPPCGHSSWRLAAPSFKALLLLERFERFLFTFE